MERVSNIHIAKLLASACIVLYLIAFAVVIYAGSMHGSSLEHMVGLDGGETSDVTEYVHLAHNLLERGAFYTHEEFGPEFLRVPGYPAFLALILKFSPTLTVIPFIQILFAAGATALIYLLGARYFNKVVGIAAAVIYMADPVVMYTTWVPIAESSFMFFFLASIYLLGTSYRRWWVPIVAAAILFGISVYMRPVGLYLSVIVAALTFAHGPWRKALRNSLLFLAVFLCVLSPWMLRNYNLSGHFAFSSGGAFNLYFANLSTFEQARTGVNYNEVFQQNNANYFDNIQEEDVLRSFKYSDKQLAIAKEGILAHPFQYAIFHTAKSMQLFVGSSIVNVNYHLRGLGIIGGGKPVGEGAWGMLLQHRWRDAGVQTISHAPRLFERLLWLATYLFMLATVVLAIRRRSENLIFILWAFILVHAVAFMTGPSSDDTRYRMPLEPFLLLLAAQGACLLWQKTRIKLTPILPKFSKKNTYSFLQTKK